MNPHEIAWRLVTATLLHGKAGPDSAQSAVLERVSDEHWPLILSLTNAHLMTPAFWLGLCRSRIQDTVPREPRRYLDGIYKTNRHRNEALRAQLDHVIRALNGRGIVPTLLKGAAYLKARVHPDIGTRFCSDLDILVPNPQLTDAQNALDQLGYQSSLGHKTDYHGCRHVRPVYRPGDPGAVEIHKDAVGSSALKALSTASLLADASEIESNGVRYNLPSPTDAVLLSFLHSEIADRYLEEFVLGLRPIHDLLALNSRYGERIDWHAILHRVVRNGHSDIFRKYLYAAYRLAQLQPLPDVRFRHAEKIHYWRCETRMTRPKLERWLMRTQQFSAAAIRRRYDRTGGWASVNLHRLYHAYFMLQRWIERRQERTAMNDCRETSRTLPGIVAGNR